MVSRNTTKSVAAIYQHFSRVIDIKIGNDVLWVSKILSGYEALWLKQLEIVMPVKF